MELRRCRLSLYAFKCAQEVRSSADACVVAFNGGLGWQTGQLTPDTLVRASKVRGTKDHGEGASLILSFVSIRSQVKRFGPSPTDLSKSVYA